MDVRCAALVGLLGAALAVSACGENSRTSPRTHADSALRGSIRIDGSLTVARLTAVAARRFATRHPNVRISIDHSGTERGFARFCDGEADVAHAAEAIDAKSIDRCEAGGVGWARVTVANDAVVLMVNPSNPIRCLTTDQLAQIWRGNSNVTERWSQVGGIAPTYNAPLIAWGPGTETETFAFFTLAVNRVRGVTRDYDNALQLNGNTIRNVAREAGAIGYADYALYKRSQTPVKLLAVDSGDGCVAPSPRTIADGSFRPLSRKLFVYVSSAALARPEIDAFLRAYLEHAGSAARRNGFVPLTADQLAASRAKLERLIARAAG